LDFYQCYAKSRVEMERFDISFISAEQHATSNDHRPDSVRRGKCLIPEVCIPGLNKSFHLSSLDLLQPAILDTSPLKPKSSLQYPPPLCCIDIRFYGKAVTPARRDRINTILLRTTFRPRPCYWLIRERVLNKLLSIYIRGL